jgi:hypothetical protein
MSSIDALLSEREGYVRRGLKDRVAQVDAEIERLGGVVVDDSDGEVVETVVAAPNVDIETPEAKPKATKRS